MTQSIENNSEASRFQTVVDGHTAVADYTLDGGVMTITHTEVPSELGGRGIAGELVKAALDHARAKGLKVRPECSYAASYMQRRPETADLLA